MSLTRIKDGLSAIAAEVLEDVRKEAEALILEAQAEAKESLIIAKKEADETYSVEMVQATAKAEAEKRKIESLTEVEVRIHMLQTKETLVDAAFEKAFSKLNDFTKTEEYHRYLLRFIHEAVKKVGSKNLIVHVNSADKAWLKQNSLSDLSKELYVDLQLAGEAENCIGGCKIQTLDGKLVYDNTLENRLRQLKSELRLEAARILFAKEESQNVS
jgi:vacuolar-type H+-ATPase subunit E/Vma4